jgi:hypothetical protein
LQPYCSFYPAREFVTNTLVEIIHPANHDPEKNKKINFSDRNAKTFLPHRPYEDAMPISSPLSSHFQDISIRCPGLSLRDAYLPEVPGSFKKCLSLTGRLPTIFCGDLKPYSATGKSD